MFTFPIFFGSNKNIAHKILDYLEEKLPPDTKP